MWIRIGAAAPCFCGPGKRGRLRRGGVCVHRARQSSGCAWGPRPPRERLAMVKVLTHRKRQRKKDREREREWEFESGGAGRERERTLPGVSFFLSAIINGILPLTHSSLWQTKDPAFQCSLTGQPASHPVQPHCSHSLNPKSHPRGGRQSEDAAGFHTSTKFTLFPFS